MELDTDSFLPISTPPRISFHFISLPSESRRYYPLGLILFCNTAQAPAPTASAYLLTMHLDCVVTFCLVSSLEGLSPSITPFIQQIVTEEMYVSGPALGTGKYSRKQERSYSNGAYILVGETEEKPETYQLVTNVREKRQGLRSRVNGIEEKRVSKGLSEESDISPGVMKWNRSQR